MNTQAISNRAMNYENAHRRFKISKLEMKVQDPYLDVTIASPLLTGTNHTIQIKKNKIRLKITKLHEANQPIELPLECDLFLPKPGYEYIQEHNAKKGLITLRLAQATSALSTKAVSHQQIA